MIDGLTSSTLDVLLDSGEQGEALAVAVELASRLEAIGDVWDLVSVRAAQARVLAIQGEGAKVIEVLDWLETAARGTEDPQSVVFGLGSSALVRASLGQDEAADALLTEIESHPGARKNENYSVMLAAMVRAALMIEDLTLAQRLVDGVEPRYPYAELALLGANAALAEARGDLQAAVDGYADAVERWEGFGVVPEQAFALLGQGRCLVGLSRRTQATPVLRHARKIFLRLEAAPALAETDALLQQATALGS
jgi:hypothetical protein